MSAVLAVDASQRPGSSTGTDEAAAIEKLHQHDIAATVSRDPVALTQLWTDDAIRLGPGQPADIGKQAIRESDERRWALQGVKVLSYVPDVQDVTMLDGWQSNGVTSPVRISNHRVASQSRCGVRCWRC